jgi:cytochrome c oxidase subunit II
MRWTHRLAVMGLIGVSPVVALACTSDELPVVPAGDAVLTLGQGVYNGNCAPCHGATGGGGVGLKLNQGRLLERVPNEADQRALVVNGKGQMPKFGGKLRDEEIEAVVRYTREIIAEQAQ